MSALTLNCTLTTFSEATPGTAAPVEGADINVGTKLLLNCSGDTSVIHTDKLEIKTKEMNDEVPAFSLLKVESATPNQLQLVVTSYHTGAHKADDIVLFDGENKISLTGFDTTIKSILKQDPTSPPQPYPAFGMARMSYPIWFWILVGVILITIILGPYLQFQKIKRRKKQFEDVKNFDTAMNPLDAFFKEMRKLEKLFDVEPFAAQNFTDKLLLEFKIFLTRRMQLPIHLWADKQTLKEIQKKYPKLSRDHANDFKKFFAEFKTSKPDLSKKHALFLQKEAQKLVEAVDVSLEKYSGGKK